MSTENETAKKADGGTERIGQIDKRYIIPWTDTDRRRYGVGGDFTFIN